MESRHTTHASATAETSSSLNSKVLLRLQLVETEEIPNSALYMNGKALWLILSLERWESNMQKRNRMKLECKVQFSHHLLDTVQTL